MIIKSVTPISVTASGRGIHPLPGPIEVTKCDFLAWRAGGSLILAAHPQRSSYSFAHGIPTVSGNTLTKSLTVTAETPFIRALTSKPSLIFISHTYVTSLPRNLRVNVTSTVLMSASHDAMMLDIVEGINETVISNPMYGARTEVVPFTIEPHTGKEEINVNIDLLY